MVRRSPRGTKDIHELVAKDIAQILVDISRIACGRYLCLLLVVGGIEELIQDVDLRQ